MKPKHSSTSIFRRLEFLYVYCYLSNVIQSRRFKSSISRFQGQCSVTKALEFNARPKHSSSFVSRRLEEENCYRGWYLSLGVTDSETGRTRSYSTEVEIMNELRISIEQIDLRKIAKTHIVDDDYEVMSR